MVSTITHRAWVHTDVLRNPFSGSSPDYRDSAVAGLGFWQKVAEAEVLRHIQAFVGERVPGSSDCNPKSQSARALAPLQHDWRRNNVSRRLRRLR